jgi:outer membrane protein TolC
MEAQTAWYKAQSEFIDAKIAVRLGQVELNKALGVVN